MRVPTFKLELVKERGATYNAPAKITDPRAAAALFRKAIGPTDREHFVAIFIDTKNHPTGLHTVSVGSLTASIVHPREVFKAAILHNAAAVILGHNHPSGGTEPSREDLDITQRLKECGDLLGIKVMDHIIIGDEDNYSSFSERGQL